MSNNSTRVDACDDVQFCQTFSLVFRLDVMSILLSAIDCAFLLGTVLINAVFVATILSNHRLRNASNYLLLNLSIVNGVFGSFGFAFCVLFRLQHLGCNVQLCVTQECFLFFAITGICLSITSFTAISIERYICIFYSLIATQIVTTKRVVMVIAVIWLGLLSMLTPFFVLGYRNSYFLVFTLATGTSTVLLLATNGRIFKEVKRHLQRIAQATPQDHAETDDARRAREARRAKTIIIMIAIVFLCYLPSLVLVLLGRIRDIDQVSLQVGWLVCRSLPLSHMMFGILVYGLRDKEIMTSVKNLFNKPRIGNIS